MKISEAVRRLQETLDREGDGELFISKGDHSTQVIDALGFDFCEQPEGWVKCLSRSCDQPKIRGVLFL